MLGSYSLESPPPLRALQEEVEALEAVREASIRQNNLNSRRFPEPKPKENTP